MNIQQHHTWVVYEIPGHKVGMCNVRNFPNRPKQQVNELTGAKKHSKVCEGSFRKLAELNELTRKEAVAVETEWSDKLGYLVDADKTFLRHFDESSFCEESFNAKLMAKRGTSKGAKPGKLHPNFKGTIRGVNLETGETIEINGKRQAVTLGFTPSVIYKCLSGKVNKHRGFVWSRVEMGV